MNSGDHVKTNKGTVCSIKEVVDYDPDGAYPALRLWCGDYEATAKSVEWTKSDVTCAACIANEGIYEED
jgi:hypothetical protein